MSRKGWRRFCLGAAGAMLPLLVTLVTLDIVDIIDNYKKLTAGLYIGTFIQIISLFILGGVVAALNSDEDRPIKLVQLGIAAPALVASFINVADAHADARTGLGRPAGITVPMHGAGAFDLFGSAHASEAQRFGELVQEKIILAAGLFEDILKGATRPVGRAIERKTLPTPPTTTPVVTWKCIEFCGCSPRTQAPTTEVTADNTMTFTNECAQKADAEYVGRTTWKTDWEDGNLFATFSPDGNRINFSNRTVWVLP